MEVSVLDIFLISVGSFALGFIVAIEISEMLIKKYTTNALHPLTSDEISEMYKEAIYENNRNNTGKKGIKKNPE